MSQLFHGDCLEVLQDIDDESVDFIFCDLPYGQTSCKWDCPIDLDKFWIEIMRVKKLHTPIFMTTTTKFGVNLITSAPKKCPFRYDLVWVKSAPAGFLSAKKMPMRKHEMVYAFYEKLPLYDLSSHTHKFIKAVPTSVVKEPEPEPEEPNSNKNSELYGALKDNGYHHLRKKGETTAYDPPLPNSILEIKTTMGKHSTEKPVALMEWLLKYYSKEGDVVLDPTMGSGSTGVACKNMNRNFIGIEMDDEIYEVACNRIES